MQSEKRWFIITKRWCFLKILTVPDREASERDSPKKKGTIIDKDYYKKMFTFGEHFF